MLGTLQQMYGGQNMRKKGNEEGKRKVMIEDDDYLSSKRVKKGELHE